VGGDLGREAVSDDGRPNWVVGSNANLPVLPGTLDRVLCMFGFPVYAEFARVLKANGQLLQVDAGPDHLRELREIIYPTLKPERACRRTGASRFCQRVERNHSLSAGLAARRRLPICWQ
jgi:ubiquinone/menaquinone biosynthesis C-methylase UbiE